MDNARETSAENGGMMQTRNNGAVSSAEYDAFLASLEERFHPDRVNVHLWHCRTQEEFDRERDRIWDDEDDLHAQPELDGGNDTWFTDRN